MSKPLYVGIEMDTDMDVLWSRTQEPSQHERWDLRFSTIEYLPKDYKDAPQQFLYATRLGFGLRVAGWGESVATHEQDSTRTSSLRFGSNQAISLIEEGSGYWKYTPRDGIVRFETGYDYRVRWGLLGRLIDTLVFRPLIGWATAWSFDRLRLWIESGIDPTLSALRSVVHAVCRGALAIVFLWHGLVPKLIMRHPEELHLIKAAGFEPGVAQRLLTLMGVFEVMFALVLLLFWRTRWLYFLTGVALVALMIPAITVEPELIFSPFTPITLTISMLGLCIAGWVACVDLPSAKRCSRSKHAMQKKAGGQ